MIQNYLDKTKNLEERKRLFKEEEDRMMNPISPNNFDPNNFEPLASDDEKELLNRKRSIPLKILPLFGLKPKEIREGQMIGMYESKQDLYLIFAYRCNELQKKVEELENRIKELEK